MKCLLTAVLLILTTPIFAGEREIKQMIDPIVEVSLGNESGGSGSVVYSRFNNTFILTCYHVISSKLRTTSEGNEISLKIDIKFRKALDGGYDVREVRKPGFVVSYDIDRDLALVWVQEFEVDAVANLLPPDEKPALFEETWTVGNPLVMGYTYFTSGEVCAVNIPHEHEDVPHKYLCTNAPIYLGFSGGAAFVKRGDNYYLAGVANGITSHGFNALFWMAYYMPINEVREFLAEKGLLFVEFDILPIPEFDIEQVSLPTIEIKVKSL